MSQKSQPTNAGIIAKGDGDHFIPASTRPDGTVRKEIKIRPGYKPPEDVATYKNQTAEAWKNKGSGGVPGAEPAEGASSSSSNQPQTKASIKNAKKREAKKRAKAAQAEASAEVTSKSDL